jgi:hypothetical protein
VTPSERDKQTFARSFGGCDWAVMFILGRTGDAYARLAFAAGPGGEMLLPTAVDWSTWPACLTTEPGMLEARVTEWRQEYAAHVEVLPDLVDGFLDQSAEGRACDRQAKDIWLILHGMLVPRRLRSVGS